MHSVTTVDGDRVSSSGCAAGLGGRRHERTRQRLLGRPYIIDGQRGGMATRLVASSASPRQISASSHNPLPMTGVFAVEVSRARRPAACPAWPISASRPTVGGTRPLLEVHLFDFDRDIYGAHLSVRFVHKLRNEQRFPNFDALKAQIAADAVTARAYFKL